MRKSRWRPPAGRKEVAELLRPAVRQLHLNPRPPVITTTSSPGACKLQPAAFVTCRSAPASAITVPQLHCSDRLAGTMSSPRMNLPLPSAVKHAHRHDKSRLCIPSASLILRSSVPELANGPPGEPSRSFASFSKVSSTHTRTILLPGPRAPSRHCTDRLFSP